MTKTTLVTYEQVKAMQSSSYKKKQQYINVVCEWFCAADSYTCEFKLNRLSTYYAYDQGSASVIETGIWPVTWENVPSDMCARQRLKLACASVQSDQSHRCPHEETFRPWLSKKYAQWRFWSDCACAVWSESSLGKHMRRYFSWRFGSYGYCVKTALPEKMK